MKQLVKLWKRPSYDGRSFTYYMIYKNDYGKRKQKSLGHSDRRKAERQRAEFERELRTGSSEPYSMSLREFTKDSLVKTGDQIRESSRNEYKRTMNDFIEIIGNICYRDVKPTHGEHFRQVCIDKGESPATVSKKLREIKRFFNLAVQRQQLDENPLQYVKLPKVPKKKIKIYKEDEIKRILKAASKFQQEDILEWDILITLALTTGMRKGELLNLVWSNIDFEEMTVEVSPKEDTAHTWLWYIKDTDHRILPLKEDVSQLLIALQNRRPEGYPYVFIPPCRYDYIQQVLRKTGKWTLSSARNSIINNFTRQFDKILKLASVEKKTFHDIRRTAITNWFRQGLKTNDVMVLAGHANFNTTHKFYLAVADDLISRARNASTHEVSSELLEKCRRNQLEEIAP